MSTNGPAQNPPGGETPNVGPKVPEQDDPPAADGSWPATLRLIEEFWSQIEWRGRKNAIALIARENWAGLARPTEDEIFSDAVNWLLSGDGCGSYKDHEAETAAEARQRLEKLAERASAAELREGWSSILREMMSSLVGKRAHRAEYKMPVALLSEFDHYNLCANAPAKLVKTVVEFHLPAKAHPLVEGLQKPKFAPQEDEVLLLKKYRAKLAELCGDPFICAVADAWDAGELDHKNGAHSAFAARYGRKADAVSKAKHVIREHLKALEVTCSESTPWL